MSPDERTLADAPAPGMAAASDEEARLQADSVSAAAAGPEFDPDLEDGSDEDPAFEFESAGQAAEPGWDSGREYGSDNAAVRRPGRVARTRRPRYVDETEPDESVELAARQAEATAVELRLAHLHLLTGSYDLARIQLETLVGAGRLDGRGLVDLAESRWRSGDLTGAADAVDAYLAAGGDAPIGFVIAAEARSAEGRPSDARRFARQAMERLTLPLDVLFAGQPRSSVWPHDPAQPLPTTDTLFGSAAAAAVRGGRIGVAERRPGDSAGRGSADVGGRSGRGSGDAGTAGAAAADAGAARSTETGADLDNDRRPIGRPVRPAHGFWDNEPVMTKVPVDPVAAGAAPSAPDEAAAERLVEFSPGQRPMPTLAASVGMAATPATPELAAPAARQETAMPASAATEWSAAPAPSSLTPDAHLELERARDALRDDDLHTAAVRLAVVLRLSPALAPIVLDLVGELPGSEFDLLRGDALRLVGHESAAQRAYADAMAGLGTGAEVARPSAVSPPRADPLAPSTRLSASPWSADAPLDDRSPEPPAGEAPGRSSLA